MSLETNPETAIAQLQNAQISTWSEEKKKDFVETFEQRSKAARYILERTAELILRRARDRHYISDKHVTPYPQIGARDGFGWDRSCFVSPNLFDTRAVPNGYNNGSTIQRTGTVGGREIPQLDKIAEERAKLILDELPQLRDAVKIIDPDTAEKMDTRDKLLKQGQQIADQLTEEFSEPISAKDYAKKNPKATVTEFLDFLKSWDKKRKSLLAKLEEIGTEGSEIADEINKQLYKGLPGLSDAVVKVAKEHLDRSLALDEMQRRVGEKVKFGDSEAALELLKHFESDEVSISEDVRSQFRAAMAKLQLAGKKASKQLKSKE
jgi:hypothetical protein